jgi:hypothetical protein
MIVDTAYRTTSAAKPDLAEPGAWSDAEFFDELPDGLVLRALICSHRGGAEWQWTISSLDRQDRGELISAGIEITSTRRVDSPRAAGFFSRRTQ